MKENLNIDELLSEFIDGQLSTRQQTEVKRLIQNDPEIAKRLRELQRCKMLIGSLPADEAPQSVLEDVKATLERKTLLGQHSGLHSERQGARYLLARKVLTAAAMIGLVAVLAVLVYSILAPEAATENTLALKSWQSDIVITPKKPTTFSGKLVLNTNNLSAAHAVIKRAINDNLPSGQSTQTILNGAEGPYVLNCSKETLAALLADLENVWDRFDSKTLFIDADKTTVNNVTTRQITEIAHQTSLKNRVKIAKDFAASNSMTQQIPGKEVFATLENTKPQLMTPPKPVLTSSEKKTKEPVALVPDEQKIQLTIVLTHNQ
ncbi:MAG: hypothetical protein KAS75_06060 [Planctomycetes bacterium]|nr:hypothetical protein [Planctomycetota bacterium]